jgi:ankyrin repeat protein
MNRYILFICTLFVTWGPTSFAQGSLDDLFNAAKVNDVAEVRQFLDRGMDPSSTDKQGNTLLIYAAREGHIELVRLLLDRKANVNARHPRTRRR